MSHLSGLLILLTFVVLIIEGWPWSLAPLAVLALAWLVHCWRRRTRPQEHPASAAKLRRTK